MARDFNPATPDYLYTDALPITTYPFTMSIWALVDSNTVNRCLIGLFDTATANNYHMIYASTGGYAYYALQAGGGVVQTGLPSNAYTLDVWSHFCAIGATSTSRTFIQDFLGPETSGTDRTPAGIDRFAIGVRASSALDIGHDGYLANAAIWDVALTTAEAYSLSRGFSPLQIRPANLVAYWPLIGRTNPEIDIVGGYNLTLSGAPGIAPHPPVRMASRLFSVHGAAGAPPVLRRSWGTIF